MTNSSNATETSLQAAQVEDTRLIAELASVEEAGDDALLIARLRIESELSARRVADARAAHQVALDAEKEVAAHLLMDTVAPMLDAEDVAVWQAVQELKLAVDRVLDADRHRNSTVASLSAELISVAGGCISDRFQNPQFGGMTVDGRHISRTSEQVGTSCIGVVTDVVTLGNVQLGHMLRSAACTGDGLRPPVATTAGGAK